MPVLHSSALLMCNWYKNLLKYHNRLLSIFFFSLWDFQKHKCSSEAIMQSGKESFLKECSEGISKHQVKSKEWRLWLGWRQHLFQNTASFSYRKWTLSNVESSTCNQISTCSTYVLGQKWNQEFKIPLPISTHRAMGPVVNLLPLQLSLTARMELHIWIWESEVFMHSLKISPPYFISHCEINFIIWRWWTSAENIDSKWKPRQKECLLFGIHTEVKNPEQIGPFPNIWPKNQCFLVFKILSHFWKYFTTSSWKALYKQDMYIIK